MKHVTIFTLLIGVAIITIMGYAGQSVKPVLDETYNPPINPADFVPTINNPYLPLTPGTTFIYEGQTEDGMERIEVSVTHGPK